MNAFPFDAVLFDCDGVLVDSEPITGRILRDMLADLGWEMTLEEAMAVFIGKTVKDEAPLIAEKTGFAVTPEWLESFQVRRNIALDSELLPIPGSLDAVSRLHDMLEGRIAVASGADRRKVVLQLKKVGIHPFVADRIFSGYEMPRSKPAPDVYLAAAAALGVDPKRCAVIEDTVTGATAGVAAGATVFGYSPGGPGHSRANALRETGASAIFEDMHALPDLLARWTSGD